MVFSFEPRCQGEWGSQKKTGRPVSIVNWACWDISLPWSQARDLRSSSGSRLISAVSWSRVAAAVREVFDFVDGDCDLDIVGIDSPSRSVYTRRNITPQQGSCGGLTAEPGGKREKARPFREPVRRADRNDDGVFDACDVAIELAERSRADRGGAR